MFADDPSDDVNSLLSLCGSMAGGGLAAATTAQGTVASPTAVSAEKRVVVAVRVRPKKYSGPERYDAVCVRGVERDGGGGGNNNSSSAGNSNPLNTSVGGVADGDNEGSSGAATGAPQQYVLIADPTAKADPLSFPVDRMLDESDGQDTVFSDLVQPALMAAFDSGGDALFVAYGQTGSGKTYTMLGDMASISSSERHSQSPSRRSHGSPTPPSALQHGSSPTAGSAGGGSTRLSSTAAAAAFLAAIDHRRSGSIDNSQGPTSSNNNSHSHAFQAASTGLSASNDDDDVLSQASAATGTSRLTVGGQPAAPRHLPLLPTAGVLMRVISALLDVKQRYEQQGGWHVVIALSAIEVYNETLFDLLAGCGAAGSSASSSSASAGLAMSSSGAGGRPSSSRGGAPGELFSREVGDDLHIPNLQRAAITNPTQARYVLGIAHRNRAVAATNMNDTSSRSHAIFTAEIFMQQRTAFNPHPPNPTLMSEYSTFGSVLSSGNTNTTNNTGGTSGGGAASPSLSNSVRLSSSVVGRAAMLSGRGNLSGRQRDGGGSIAGGSHHSANTASDAGQTHHSNSHSNNPPSDSANPSNDFVMYPFKCARVTMVDLAGSERVKRSGVSGKELSEAVAVNKSLSALGHVVNQLCLGTKHINFRDSKLTRLLRAPLCNPRSRIAFITNISPAATNYAESVCSLRFAARLKEIKAVPQVAAAAAQAAAAKAEDEMLHRLGVLEELCADMRIARDGAGYAVFQKRLARIAQQRQQELGSNSSGGSVTVAPALSLKVVTQRYADAHREQAETARVLELEAAVQQTIATARALAAAPSHSTTTSTSHKHTATSTSTELRPAVKALAAAAANTQHIENLQALSAETLARNDEMKVLILDLDEKLSDLHEQVNAANRLLAVKGDTKRSVGALVDEEKRLDGLIAGLTSPSTSIRAIEAAELEQLRRQLDADEAVRRYQQSFASSILEHNAAKTNVLEERMASSRLRETVDALQAEMVRAFQEQKMQRATVPASFVADATTGAGADMSDILGACGQFIQQPATAPGTTPSSPESSKPASPAYAASAMAAHHLANSYLQTIQKAASQYQLQQQQLQHHSSNSGGTSSGSPTPHGSAIRRTASNRHVPDANASVDASEALAKVMTARLAVVADLVTAGKREIETQCAAVLSSALPAPPSHQQHEVDGFVAGGGGGGAPVDSFMLSPVLHYLTPVAAEALARKAVRQLVLQHASRTSAEGSRFTSPVASTIARRTHSAAFDSAVGWRRTPSVDANNTHELFFKHVDSGTDLLTCGESDNNAAGAETTAASSPAAAQQQPLAHPVGQWGLLSHAASLAALSPASSSQDKALSPAAVYEPLCEYIKEGLYAFIAHGRLVAALDQLRTTKALSSTILQEIFAALDAAPLDPFAVDLIVAGTLTRQTNEDVSHSGPSPSEWSGDDDDQDTNGGGHAYGNVGGAVGTDGGYAPDVLLGLIGATGTAHANSICASGHNGNGNGGNGSGGSDGGTACSTVAAPSQQQQQSSLNFFPRPTPLRTDTKRILGTVLRDAGVPSHAAALRCFQALSLFTFVDRCGDTAQLRAIVASLYDTSSSSIAQHAALPPTPQGAVALVVGSLEEMRRRASVLATCLNYESGAGSAVAPIAHTATAAANTPGNTKTPPPSSSACSSARLCLADLTSPRPSAAYESMMGSDPAAGLLHAVLSAAAASAVPSQPSSSTMDVLGVLPSHALAAAAPRSTSHSHHHSPPSAEVAEAAAWQALTHLAYASRLSPAACAGHSAHSLVAAIALANARASNVSTGSASRRSTTPDSHPHHHPHAGSSSSPAFAAAVMNPALGGSSGNGAMVVPMVKVKSRDLSPLAFYVTKVLESSPQLLPPPDADAETMIPHVPSTLRFVESLLACCGYSF